MAEKLANKEIDAVTKATISAQAIVTAVMTMTIGQELQGFGAAPIISNDRTLVPISYISKQLGANVVWVPSTRTVFIAK